MNRIKEVLAEKGIFQTWLARRLGVDYKTVNAYAQNKYQPSLLRLVEISRLLSVDIGDLLDSELINNKNKNENNRFK